MVHPQMSNPQKFMELEGKLKASVIKQSGYTKAIIQSNYGTLYTNIVRVKPMGNLWKNA